MYCRKCGTENDAENKFCIACGSLLHQEHNETVTKRKNKKSNSKVLVGISIAVLLFACVIAAILILPEMKKEKQYSDLLVSAQCYLEELDYEKAEAAYLEAISIDPMQELPYLYLAEMYMEQGQGENAKNILIEGYETTGNTQLHNKYQEYVELIEQKEKEEHFYETCWLWHKDMSGNTSYAVLFHLDGTFNYYKIDEGLMGSSIYTYEKGMLRIDDVDYNWQNGQFISAEPVSYTLVMDEQEYFYQYIPVFETENFMEEIQTQYGKASDAEFVSCLGADFQTYPDSIDGFVTEATVDLNEDGKDEKVAFISKEQTIMLQVYTENNGNYLLSCEEQVATMDYCSQQNLSLFYNREMENYLLFVDESTLGAYTGNDSQQALIYTVDCNQINLVCQASANDYGLENDDIYGQLAAYGVPYAMNCAQINNITEESRYQELLEIKHRYYNSDPFGGWFGAEHYLQLIGY